MDNRRGHGQGHDADRDRHDDRRRRGQVRVQLRRPRDRVRHAEGVLADRQHPDAADKVAEQSFPDQQVQQADSDGPGSEQRQHDEQRVVGHCGDDRPGQQAHGQLVTGSLGDGRREIQRNRAERDREQHGSGEFRHHHAHPAHRRREQVDDAAVVDLSADHAGADDQRGQRQHDGEPEDAEELRRPDRAPRYDLQRHRDQQEHQRHQQEDKRALATERGAQRDPQHDRVQQAAHSPHRFFVIATPGRRTRSPATHRMAALPAD